MPFCFRWRSSSFWCCFDGFVSGVCASLSLPCPVRAAGGRDRACLPLDVIVVARPHVVPGFEFWQPGDLFWSPVRSALRQVRASRSSSESFEVVQAGFLPLTAGCSLIGGTSACSGPLLRMAALLSGHQAGDCGLLLLRIGHARVWVVACPLLVREWRAAATLVPLMPCASAGISFRSILASSRISLAWWIRRACADLLLPRPVGGLSDFSPADFSSLRLCLVERI